MGKIKSGLAGAIVGALGGGLGGWLGSVLEISPLVTGIIAAGLVLLLWGIFKMILD